MSHVLLVSPAFHGYWRSIAQSLERRGHTVASFRYDERTPQAKVRHQLLRELPERVSDRLPGRVPGRLGQRLARARHDPSPTEGALAALDSVRPDVVLAVKADVVGEEFWEVVDRRRLPRAVWLYDEVRRTTYTAERLGSIGPVASYSPADVADLTVAGVAASYLPLAFDHRVTEIDPRNRNDEVVLIGARYPRRAELVTGLAAAGVPVRVFGRDWSRHPVDLLRTWGASRPDVPAGRDLPREDAYVETAAALGALNVHNDQDGFTMRTFEACGVGGLQLIDRTDVGDLYEPHRELVTFTDLDSLLAAVERVVEDPDWVEQVRLAARARTMAEHTFDHRVGRLEELWRTW